MKKQLKATASTTPANVKISVPLSALYLSPENVRKGAVSGIEELAAMIYAQGLLNPLQVTADDVRSGKSALYGVVAGGRRFRALKHLEESGKIPADFSIDCGLITADKASEVSLTENISQEAMHPADEFEAYRSLITQGKTVEDVAGKFGVTVVHVQRRLKLANVAPVLLDLYRANEITLDQIMILASVDDQERQVRTWNGTAHYNRQPHNLKRLLIEDEIKATDARVSFVGIDTYIAAGGSIRTDLFEEGDNRFLTDPGLLEMLIADRLEAEAVNIRAEGWAWVETMAAYSYSEAQHYHTPAPKYLPETPAQTAQREALEAETTMLEEQQVDADDAEDYDKSNELDTAMSQVEAKLEALQASRLDLNDEVKAQTGVVITFDKDGLVLHKGLVRNADRKKEERAAGGSSTRPEVPEKLMLNLTSHRSMAIQALLLKNQQVALATLATKMALSTFADFHYSSSPVKVALTHMGHVLEKNAPTLPTTRAAAEIETERSAWKTRLPEDKNQWFAWFLTQPLDVVLSAIVFATASCTASIQGRADGTDDSAEIAEALALDMADWWEPTPESYLNLVPKTKLIEMVAEVAGATEAGDMPKMKKGDAIAHAMSHMQGSRWLPKALRKVEAVTETA